MTRSYTQGDVAANNTSLFAQDAWTVNDRLTLNLGIRADTTPRPVTSTIGTSRRSRFIAW